MSADLRDKLRNPNCDLCDLHAEAVTVCTRGHGPRRASIMIVGESPDEGEDAGGRPFTGPAGQLLFRALRELAGIERHDVYITNAVRCRPDDGAAPSARQLRTCSRTYLAAEIAAVRPKYILTLGNSGLTGVTGRRGITRWHGSPMPYKWVGSGSISDDIEVAIRRIDEILGRERRIRATVFPCFHPAAVLRNPKYAEPFGVDIQRFGQLVRGQDTAPDTKIHLIDSSKSLKLLDRTLQKADRIAWDIETFTRKVDPPYVRTNFQEWHGRDSMIVSISFSWREGVAAVLPLWHRDTPWQNPDAVLASLRETLLRRDFASIGHNIKYDARWMHEKGIPIHQSFCTMLAAHLLNENRSKGLKDLSRIILNAEAYDLDLTDAYNLDLNELTKYNGKDTDYTLRLANHFELELDRQPRLRAIFDHLMMPASRVLVDVERHGVYLDPDRWHKRNAEAIQRRDRLHRFIEKKYVPKKMRPFNPRSTQQVGKLLFEHYDLPVLRLTRRDRPSTEDWVLKRLSLKHPSAKAIIKYRKWMKRVSTYFTPWWYEHRDRNGRIRSTYKPAGTDTGRLSGTGGIHQVPRDPYMRSLIGAEPGWVLLNADYSQIELRVAAWLADEDNMLRRYMNNEDLHLIGAMVMAGVRDPSKITKEMRTKAKGRNFGYLYGMGWRKFIDYMFSNFEMILTEAESRAARESFFNEYPRLLDWHRRSRNMARRHLQITSPFGRVRRLPDIMSSDEGVQAEAERQAINAPVQVTASDIVLTALIELHENVLDPRVARIVYTVHDSIGFEIRPKYLNELAPEIKETMEDMSLVEDRFRCEVGVPIVVDLEAGTHWGEDTIEVVA